MRELHASGYERRPCRFRLSIAVVSVLVAAGVSWNLFMPDANALVTGGCSAARCTAPQSGVEVYDPELRTLRSSAPLLVERVGHAAVALADRRPRHG